MLPPSRLAGGLLLGYRNSTADHSRCVPAIGVERALHYTDYYKKLAPSGASSLRRSAESLAHHLDHRSIQIYDDELIVGTHTEHRIGAICHIEKAGAAMLEDVLSFEKRDVNPLAVPPGTKWTLLRRVIPYWLNRNLAMRAFSGREKLKYASEQLNAAHFVINEAAGVAHFLPDYGELIRLGTRGLRDKIEQRRRRGWADQRRRRVSRDQPARPRCDRALRGSPSRGGRATRPG